MTRRCETCAHWTAFTHEGEVVESIQGTCRESPVKVAKAADDWCGRWAPNGALRVEEIMQRLAWAHSQWPYSGMGAAYPMTLDLPADDDEPRRPWWRRIFR